MSELWHAGIESDNIALFHFLLNKSVLFNNVIQNHLHSWHEKGDIHNQNTIAIIKI